MPMQTVKSFNDLPPAFNVDLFAKTMGISRKVAFQVVKEQNLAIRVGEKRLVVIKDKVIDWLNRQPS